MVTERQISRDTARSPVAERPDVDLSSNDYLGLRNDPRVRAAAILGIERYGVGSGGAGEVAAGLGDVHELDAPVARHNKLSNEHQASSGIAGKLSQVQSVGHARATGHIPRT